MTTVTTLFVLACSMADLQQAQTQLCHGKGMVFEAPVPTEFSRCHEISFKCETETLEQSEET